MEAVLKRFLFTTIVLFTLLGCDSLYTLELTEQDISKQVSRIFPIKRTFYSILHLKVKNPDVKLIDGDNRIKFTINLEAKIGFSPQVFKGQADISGELKYRKSNGTFYFTKPQVHRVNYPGFPRQYSKKINQILTVMAKEFLNEIPVYSLNAKNDAENFAKMTLQKVSIQDKKIKIQLGL